MLLPESQLKQAQALLQDVRVYMKRIVWDEDPTTDYRVIDIFRGLALANKGLDAMIKGDQYSEYDALKQIVAEMSEFDFTDEEIK